MITQAAGACHKSAVVICGAGHSIALVAALVAFQVCARRWCASLRTVPPGAAIPDRRNQVMAKSAELPANGDTIPRASCPGWRILPGKCRSRPSLPDPRRAGPDRGSDDRRTTVSRGAKPGPTIAGGAYFLTERYLRTGRVGPRLAEMASVTVTALSAPSLQRWRLMPEAGRGAAFEGVLPHGAGFEPVVLSALAADAKNLRLINICGQGKRPLSGAPGGGTGADHRKLIEAGQFARAHDPGVSLPASRDQSGACSIRNSPSEHAAPLHWTFGRWRACPATGTGELS